MTRIEQIKAAYGDVVAELREALPDLPIRIDDEGTGSYGIVIDCGNGQWLEACDDDLARGLSSDRSAHRAWQLNWCDAHGGCMVIYRRRGDAVNKLVRAARWFCENNDLLPEDHTPPPRPYTTWGQPPAQSQVRYPLPGSAREIIESLAETAAHRRQRVAEQTGRMLTKPSRNEQGLPALEFLMAMSGLEGAAEMLAAALTAAGRENGWCHITQTEAAVLAGELIDAMLRYESLDRFFASA